MAQAPSRPRARRDFKIAIICALPLEADMVESTFDEVWDIDGKSYKKEPGDQNAYTTGMISGHNVVLAHMHGMGGYNAATVAAGLRSSYQAVEVAFVVGICGAVPNYPLTTEEIVLGDCIISTEVVQYDFGKQYPQGFTRKNVVQDCLARASLEVRALSSKLLTRGNQERLTERLIYHLKALQDKRSDISYPGAERDRLYQPLYAHQHPEDDGPCQGCSTDLVTCSRDCDALQCDQSQLIRRERLQGHQQLNKNIPPMVYCGRIGSANIVMKSGSDRNRVADELQLAAFEMEASGIMSTLPTIVVKSACDYADSHKNKEWQPYAAATAAAGLKACLESWDKIDEDTTMATGREEKLKELERIMLIDKEVYRLAIIGLGGVGKTQLARAFCYIVKENYPEFSIFWVSAISKATFAQDYGKIAKSSSLTVPDEKDLLSVVKAHLESSAAGKWLLVVDNADDTAVVHGKDGIVEHLPLNEDGVILFTTRHRELVDVAEYNLLDLDKMTEDEAQLLLTKSLRKDLLKDTLIVKRLLDELAYLPLAIVQAASYITKSSISISKYLTLMKETERDMIDLLSWEFYDNTRGKDSGNAVAMTWLVSFDQIKRYNSTATNVLLFLACIENKAIPLSIIPTPKLRSEIIHAIGTLIGFSFLSAQEDNETYEMHRLVHVALKVWMQRAGVHDQWKDKTLSHLADIFPSNKWEYRAQWQEYTPHAVRILRDTKLTEQWVKLCLSLGRCFRVDGRISEAVSWVSECEHSLSVTSRLQAQHELGFTYLVNGQVKEAIELLERVVTIRAAVLAETDPSLTASQHSLGIAYRSNGQVKEAIHVLEKVVAIREKILPENHPSQLASHYELAAAYRSNGQVIKGMQMLEKVVAIQAAALAEDHPERLAPQGLLASMYLSNGRVIDAIEMLENVVAQYEKVLTEEHPNRLANQSNLALAYKADGQLDKAILLMQHVVAVRKNSLPIDHPDRLESQSNLANAYRSNGQLDKAISLMEHVVAVEAESLRMNHPDLVRSQHDLAIAYEFDGQPNKAVSLLEHVVAAHEKSSRIDDPDRLASQHNLAMAYESDGQLDKAISLMQHVVAVRGERLPSDHPKREGSEEELSRMLDEASKSLITVEETEE